MHTNRVRIVGIGLAGAIVLAGAACSTPPKDPVKRAEYERRNDPFEKFNRRVHRVNVWIDHNIGRPVARVYAKRVPQFIRDRIRTFADHLGEPITFMNDVLQGERERAAETAVRFFVNSVAGMAGFFDVAAMYGLKRHTEDFGQTLAVWGVRAGPYLVLPVLGPSSTRHLAGRIVDGIADPLNWVGKPTVARVFFGTAGPLGQIDFYARNVDQLKSIEKNSLDYYAALRSFYRQNRKSAIANGRIKTKDIPLPGDDE